MEVETRPSVAENWMNRGNRCRRNYVRSTDCLFFQGNAGKPQGVTAAPVARSGKKNDLMPEHQKVQKRTQKIQSLKDKRKNLQKERLAAKRRSGRRRSVTFSYRTKSISISRNGGRAFRDCRLEKKEEVVMHRKRLVAVWRRWWNRFSPWERIRRGLSSMPCVKYSSEDSRPSPLPRICQGEKKEGELVKTNKSKAEPVSSWCYLGQAGSTKVHQRVVWSLIFIVFGTCLVKAKVQEYQANKEIAREDHPDHHGLQWLKKTMTVWEEWCLRQKRQKNSQGKVPRTFEESSQGRDPTTLERNSQGKDPRTWKENNQGGALVPQINSQRKDPRTFEAPVKR